LYRETLRGGAQASGRPIGALEAGLRADLVVLAPLDEAEIDERPPSLDALIFKSGAWRVYDVMTSGRFVVRGGAHVERERLRERALQAARAMRSTIA
jgi:formimidoylglutamate deiminase